MKSFARKYTKLKKGDFRLVLVGQKINKIFYYLFPVLLKRAKKVFKVKGFSMIQKKKKIFFSFLLSYRKSIKIYWSFSLVLYGLGIYIGISLIENSTCGFSLLF